MNPMSARSAGLSSGLDDTTGGPCASMTSVSSSTSPIHHHNHHHHYQHNKARSRSYQDDNDNDDDDEAPIFDSRSARVRRKSDVELGHLPPVSPASSTSLTQARRSPVAAKF